MIRKRQELVEWAREEGLRKETGGSQAIHPAMGSVLWSPGQKNQCSRQQSRLQAQEVILCYLLWPPESPSSARKSYKAFELPRSWDPGWPRAGAANIWAASGHVRGFCPSCRISMCRGAQLRGPRPGLCVGGGPTPSLRIPGACSGSPRPRAENAIGAHNPSCCNPQGWRHPGLSKNCVVSGLNSYLCVCHGSRGSRGGHKNNPKCFICFCTFLLQTTWLPVPAGSGGPARAQSYGAALSALFV